MDLGSGKIRTDEQLREKALSAIAAREKALRFIRDIAESPAETGMDARWMRQRAREFLKENL